MQINLSGHHLDITDSLRDYVKSKFSRLENHFDQVINVNVVLSVEKLRQKAEATLNLRGANLFADSTQEDMYAAIDTLTDKLDRQIIKHKERHSDHRSEALKRQPVE